VGDVGLCRLCRVDVGFSKRFIGIKLLYIFLFFEISYNPTYPNTLHHIHLYGSKDGKVGCVGLV
jgi:hypothetical protein